MTPARRAHPSDLVLDELAAGVRVDAGALSHAIECLACRRRILRILSARRETRTSYLPGPEEAKLDSRKR